MKRERVASDAGELTPKPSKKVMKSAEKPKKTETPPQDSFKPFDYSQSDLKVFAGKCFVIFCSVVFGCCCLFVFSVHINTPDLILHSVTVLQIKH